MIRGSVVICCLLFVVILAISCDALRDDNPVDPFGISMILDIHGGEIVVDGKIDDWSGVEPVAIDPIGDNKEDSVPGTDITEVYIQYSDSTSTLYLRIDLESFAGQPDVIYSVAFDLDVNDNWDYVVNVGRDGIVDPRDIRNVNIETKALNYENVSESGIPIQLEGDVRFEQKEVCELGIPMGRILEGDRDFAICPFITIVESGITADVVNKFIRVTY